MSSHVTLLALPQERPVPLEVMFLLRKSLCHTWDRKKNIYFESQSNHSELAQPFQELPGQQRNTSSERNDGSLCCQARDIQLPGKKGRVCHFDSRSKYFWPAMHDKSILYTPPTPWCRDLGTHPTNREVTYSYTRPSWDLLDPECLLEAQVLKVWSPAHGTIGRFWNR